ncbi:hypothetical protein OPV22_016702 [Ensete ventricosum]|uniref:Protein kinase domain-containing protein n=1 Tax=Ensete ventricosum TaxID=4639 RepID=A0AAV8QQK7_ENSVE|nr:hypothetical protein OPV22_016702 [Ensete ventricosum]
MSKWWCMSKSGIRLDWKWRLRIAHGAAGGLAYLHELANPPSLTETSSPTTSFSIIVSTQKSPTSVSPEHCLMTPNPTSPRKSEAQWATWIPNTT